MEYLLLFGTKKIVFLSISFLFLFISIYFYEIKDKSLLAIISLFIAALFLFVFSSSLDSFLNIWDEQFHALVAKNCLQSGFIPKLFIDAPLPYDYANWTNNHVWLHKQPLFIWQMAISLKIFGINEFAVRIPSILMMSLVPIFIYRIGKLSLNSKIGFYAALLFVSAHHVMELVTGFPPSDHNDIAFLFYITSSIWAWVEYEKSQKKYWLILIGIFSGAAILVKWLTGLLVYSGWSLSVLLNKQKRNSIKSYTDILISIFVCAVIFIPWQIYVSFAFPNESSHEYLLNKQHFFTAVEGHGGDWLYYFDNLRKVYGGGQLVPFVIIFSFYFFFKKIENKAYKISFFCFIAIVYLFFSLAATKMINFCFIVSPLIFLSIAAMLYSFFTFFQSKITFIKSWLIVCLLLVIVWFNMDLYKIAYKHTDLKPNDNDKRKEKIDDTRFIKHLSLTLNSNKYVLFNCKPWKHIPVMFYSNALAYDKMLTQQECFDLKNKGYKLAVINTGNLPEYMSKEKDVLLIDAPDSTWVSK